MTALLRIFARHPIGANLLMLLMILSGFLALERLNAQFFPDFALDIVTVRVVWRGATAEDVEQAITAPLERELRNVDGVRTMTSTSTLGVVAISLEFEEGSDLATALDDVEQQVALVRNLPADAEQPEVSRVVRYEPVAQLMLIGEERESLRWWARQFERELLDLGIARIAFNGLPEREISIEVPSLTLQQLGLSLPELAERVNAASGDLPSGEAGQVSRQLRALEQGRTTADFEALLIEAADGRRIRLGEIAHVSLRARDAQVQLESGGRPVIELALQRTEDADSLESAQILQQWLAETRPQLPSSVQLEVFNESWRLIEERLLLLLKNGANGLLLVVGILYLFLGARVATWVAIGIPVSFLATLAVLELVGGSINMISMFALIMALGIIVDDAIVVGEDAATHHEGGASPQAAAEQGAQRMLQPVLASSLTTVAAFLPLMLIGGPIGRILFDIPLVIVCVIIASLIESFLVLPGHLRDTFRRMDQKPPGRLRRKLDNAFAQLRDGLFRRWLQRALQARLATLSLALAALIMCAGLMAGGRLGFNFFPTPEGQLIYASASFVAGSPPERAEAFIREVEVALLRTESELGDGLIRSVQTRIGQVQLARGAGQIGDQYASMVVELIPADSREVRLNTFMEHWRTSVVPAPGLETFSIFAPTPGPPGRDVDIRLMGDSAQRLKEAALVLRNALEVIPGVSAVEDDMPYGMEQLIYRLTPLAQSRGLTPQAVASQLRAALDGQLVQIFQRDQDEVEVRVRLPADERGSMNVLDQLQLRLPNGDSLPLASAVTFSPQRGFEVLRHADARMALQVGADVDATQIKAGEVITRLEQGVLPTLVNDYGLRYSLEGRSADRAETLGDMRQGALIGLTLIYIVLAWVFASWGWPLIVMSIIPFGVVGALFGHWLLGIDLTILSLFGIFGLSGIVINDSIILVSFYRQLRADGLPVSEALVEAGCQRLRAVLLTSLTTIAGLLPLLFETSRQAQFLIPMAVSISFGLGFATFLVLFCLPVLLSLYENLRRETPTVEQESRRMVA